VEELTKLDGGRGIPPTRRRFRRLAFAGQLARLLVWPPFTGSTSSCGFGSSAAAAAAPRLLQREKCLTPFSIQPSVDMGKLATAIEALLNTERTSTACAGAMVGESDSLALEDAIRADLDTVDVVHATRSVNSWCPRRPSVGESQPSVLRY
jgi:hypothetical protein